MSVVGFDIGNETCVIAAAKHGNIDFLLNDESCRETPSVVSFSGKQRLIGSAGASSSMKNPRSTVSQLKRLLGPRLSLDLLERILAPCKKIFIDARLTVDTIHSIELVGSGSRIPAISRVLSEFFRREPSRTLNASECIARGCALQCAMLSPASEVLDAFPFSVGFLTDEGSDPTLPCNMLFRKGQQLPSIKMLTFHRSQEFHMDVQYADES